MWLWRRMARITWKMKRTNESVLREIGVERELWRTLKTRMKKWLGHIMGGNTCIPVRTVIDRRETRRKKGKGKKKRYTTGQSGGMKIVYTES